MSYDVTNWYYLIMDQSPGTQVYYTSNVDDFVPLSDADYLAWVAAGNSASAVGTLADFYDGTINEEARGRFKWSIYSYTSGVDLQLETPLGTSSTIKMTAPGLKVILPKMKRPTSPVKGQPFNISATSDSEPFDLYKVDGITLVTTIQAGTTAVLTLTDNTDANGTIDVLTLGGGGSSGTFDDGSNDAPSITFTLDTNTGLYREGDDEIGIAVGGTTSTTFGTDRVHILTGLDVDDHIGIAVGDEANPGLSFASDLDTGFYWISSNFLGITAGGTTLVTIGLDGASNRVHVLTDLAIDGNVNVTGFVEVGDGDGDHPSLSFTSQPSIGFYLYDSSTIGLAHAGLAINSNFNLSDGVNSFINVNISTGNIGINYASAPPNRLYVSGTFGATDNIYGSGGLALATPTTMTGTSGTVDTSGSGVGDFSVIVNGSGNFTLTLPPPGDATRLLLVKTIVDHKVDSASSNVVPLLGGSAGTEILQAEAGQWVLLQSDLTNWNVVAAGSDDLRQQAWTTFTPTVTPGAGSITSSTSSGRWKKIGKTVFWDLTIHITTNGTGSAYLSATLPFTSSGGGNQAAYGKETGLTNKMCSGVIGASTSSVTIQLYDGTYPGADGATVVMSGICEVV